MTDSPQVDPPTEDAELGALKALRSLLVGQEQTQLAHIQERLDNPSVHANDVSRVLPDAIALRGRQDGKLASALQPTVEEVLKQSVKRNPAVLVDAIFPVIGPAIRKSIAEALRGMVQAVNGVVENTLSIRSIRWRIEAMRTGRPFAEVMLAHTLLYRVEQIFLIHKETSLLIQHVVAPAVATSQEDTISAMLTAIQDFVRDSFRAGQGEHLESFQVGSLAVWVEQGPRAILAAVILGHAPQEFRFKLQSTLEKVHAERLADLEGFKGDSTPFELVRDDLESCLQAQKAEEAKGGGSRRRYWPWLIAAVLTVSLGLWAFFSIRDGRRWEAYLGRLRAEPGIVVVTAERRGGEYRITGLRDTLAADPRALLDPRMIDPARVVGRWELAFSSDPTIVLKRARGLLLPPATVDLAFKEGILSAAGSAPSSWVEEARRRVPLVAGVVLYDDSALSFLD